MDLQKLRSLSPVNGVVSKARSFGRHIRHPVRRHHYRARTSEIARAPKLADLVDQNAGYAFLTPGMVSGVDEALTFCRQILEERRDRPELWAAPPRKYKDYPITLFRPFEYDEAPPLFDLVLGDQILQIASDYFGELPVVQSIKVRWTPTNKALKGSQFYHRDASGWGYRNLKFIFNVTNVADDAGPFTFLPADISKQIHETLDRSPERVPDKTVFPERVPDETIYSVAAEKDVQKLVGPPGLGCAIDSSRCFHFGSRARGAERLALFFNFRPFLNPMRIRKVPRVSEAFRHRLAADPVRRLVYPVAGVN